MCGRGRNRPLCKWVVLVGRSVRDRSVAISGSIGGWGRKDVGAVVDCASMCLWLAVKASEARLLCLVWDGLNRTFCSRRGLLGTGIDRSSCGPARGALRTEGSCLENEGVVPAWIVLWIVV